MSDIEYDAIITVNFYPSSDGGRKGPTPENFFNCPMVIDDKKYDCRLLLGNTGSIKPSSSATVPVKFLDADTVLAILKEGDSFQLWEGKIIADGKVVAMAN